MKIWFGLMWSLTFFQPSGAFIEARQLRAEDFQGYPPAGGHASGTVYYTKTFPLIATKKTGYYELKAAVWFSRSESWMPRNYALMTALQKTVLLTHERYHLLAQQIGVRSLICEVAKHKFKSKEAALLEIDRALKQFREWQDRYDKATSHGTNLIVQEEWQKQIDDKNRNPCVQKVKLVGQP